MSDLKKAKFVGGESYRHPDGTVFTRSKFGNWYGTDGTEVSDEYITFRWSVDQRQEIY